MQFIRQYWFISIARRPRTAGVVLNISQDLTHEKDTRALKPSSRPVYRYGFDVLMKALKAYSVYLIMKGSTGLFFSLIVTVNLVYHTTVVGLTPLQLVLVGTVLEASVLLFEIPTGVIADVYSRRLSVIIGTVLLGVGFIIEGAFPQFEMILLAQVIWGIGSTFLSGATEAWIADETTLLPDGKRPSLSHVFLRGNQMAQVGGLVGIGLSILLASFNITWPIILGGTLYLLLAVFLCLFMPENGFCPAPKAERDSWQATIRTTREGAKLVRGKPTLLAILAIALIMGLAGEGWDRLWTPHLLENITLPPIGPLDPIVWFGLISAVSMLLAIGVTEVIRRYINTDSQSSLVKTFMGLYGILIVGIVLYGMTTSLATGLVAFWIVGMVHGLLTPLLQTWINQQAESNVRATVLSIQGQTNALGQMVGGPAVGAIGTYFTLRAAIVTTGFLLLPVLVVLHRTLRQSKSACEA